MAQLLTDANNRKIGSTEQNGDQIRLYDANDRWLGTYNMTTNKTENSNGHIVGNGNILTTLLRN